MRKAYLFLIITLFFGLGNGSNILVLFPMGSHSHFTLGFRLAKGLADRGHNVTFISPYPQKTRIKNLREISVEEIMEFFNVRKMEYFKLGKMSYLDLLYFSNRGGVISTEMALRNRKVQELLHSDEKFDLVLYENFWNEAFMVFAHKFNCPLVILAPLHANIFINYFFSNPHPSSYIPNPFSCFSAPMTFWQRMVNTFYDIVAEIFVYNVMLPSQDAVLKRVLPNAPDLENIIYNSSLILLISHPSFTDPVSLPPTIKQIGGYHVSPPKPLPNKIQKFLDGAKDGAIIFSMGSNLNSSLIPKDKKDAIIRVFSRMKQRILWKCEETLPGTSQNVKLLKWIPQQDVLAHPNVILFVSHVGLLGMTEAVYHAVPILGLPVMWDQEINIDNAVRRGFALKISFSELNEENFAWALNELVNDPKYRQNAKMRSTILHDQPMKPLDEGIYWIEYVIRHKGAHHLRSIATDLKWYQRYLLDVTMFVLLAISILILTVYIICRNIFGGKSIKNKKE
uniref:UDP-glycosyltransferase n=1 Tax=Xylotrechus quadripes TaxID=554073 RepID=A0A6G7SET7_9CUCU|nr:UDP-glycosyltransferase [Xylotrechus quadripes]